MMQNRLPSNSVTPNKVEVSHFPTMRAGEGDTLRNLFFKTQVFLVRYMYRTDFSDLGNMYWVFERKLNFQNREGHI